MAVNEFIAMAFARLLAATRNMPTLGDTSRIALRALAIAGIPWRQATKFNNDRVTAIIY
jgi:hypothetical protein